jgi:PIN domain nuclease of toxin-antitoxin system
MVTRVLDASAVLRFLLGGAGDRRVGVILASAQTGVDRAIICAVDWGEVVGKIYKSQGRYAADNLTTTLQFYGLEIIPVGTDGAARAALLKVDLKLGDADAFCVELSSGIANSVIITADHDFQAAAALVSTLEFLPNNPLHHPMTPCC